ncbi:hypothetical protein [Streptomyces sp. WZ-12]|uniref:hypothetical protein n=1 Tax=Streptomyces sp. WZ-12 TaxID=3030210 RepID=UPI0023814DA5|nr:hypothetical protein [Streptomyces sp. WZ-12]
MTNSDKKGDRPASIRTTSSNTPIEEQWEQATRWALEQGLEIVESCDSIGEHDRYLDLLNGLLSGKHNDVALNDVEATDSSAQRTALINIAQRSEAEVHLATEGTSASHDRHPSNADNNDESRGAPY